MFDRLLNMPRILSMPAFRIYQGSKYASGTEYQGSGYTMFYTRVTQGSKYARISLTLSEWLLLYIYSL